MVEWIVLESDSSTIALPFCCAAKLCTGHSCITRPQLSKRPARRGKMTLKSIEGPPCVE